MTETVDGLALPAPTEEVWRPIEGFPGYQVSSFGRVKTPKGKICESKIDCTGSVRPHITDAGGRRTKITMQMLVATAFLKDPGDGSRPFHRDENKANNHLHNIGWTKRISALQPTKPGEEIERWAEYYPGYDISSLGRVRLPNGNFSKAKPGPDGFTRVVLLNPEGQTEVHLIQQLVAEAFLPKVEGKTYARHKNGVGHENRLSNLYWDDPPPEPERIREGPVEEWRELERYPGYQISTYGNLKCLKGCISKVSPNDEGYIRYTLIRFDGKKVSVSAHHLVATAFIPNPLGKPYANHVNGIRDYNRVSNLEWSTVKENSSAAKKIFIRAKIAGRPIVQYKLDGIPIKIWDKGSDIYFALELQRRGIIDCCKGVNDSFGGFIWRYYDEVIDLPGEEWKWAVDDKITILVSNYGRVHTKSGKRTFGCKSSMGYMLYDGHRIHRLVCIAFKPRDDYRVLEVDHLDEMRSHNHTNNLEWVTSSENIQRSYDRKVRKYNPHRRQVYCFTAEGTFIKQYSSVKEASDETDTRPSSISQAASTGCMGGQYRWRYVE